MMIMRTGKTSTSTFLTAVAATGLSVLLMDAKNLQNITRLIERINALRYNSERFLLSLIRLVSEIPTPNYEIGR